MGRGVPASAQRFADHDPQQPVRHRVQAGPAVVDPLATMLAIEIQVQVPAALVEQLLGRGQGRPPAWAAGPCVPWAWAPPAGTARASSSQRAVRSQLAGRSPGRVLPAVGPVHQQVESTAGASGGRPPEASAGPTPAASGRAGDAWRHSCAVKAQAEQDRQAGVEAPGQSGRTTTTPRMTQQWPQLLRLLQALESLRPVSSGS